MFVSRIVTEIMGEDSRGQSALPLNQQRLCFRLIPHFVGILVCHSFFVQTLPETTGAYSGFGVRGVEQNDGMSPILGLYGKPQPIADVGIFQTTLTPKCGIY